MRRASERRLDPIEDNSQHEGVVACRASGELIWGFAVLDTAHAGEKPELRPAECFSAAM